MGLTSILYRGALASCNYGCRYCPFRAKKGSWADMSEDQQALNRFLSWLERLEAPDDVAVFFTPQGEALIHEQYRQAMIRLSRLINKVVIQTNLSCRLDWLAEVKPQHVALWCSFHPDQVDIDVFLHQCAGVARHGVPFSVGVVGIKENLPIIRELRHRLPRHVYLWVNAFKHQADYYSPADLRDFSAIDPYFSFNTKRYCSFGHPCACGSRVFAVDGRGDIRSCHFSEKTIGNIYTGGLPQPRERSLCDNEYCWCHIGYVHLEHLGLKTLFGNGVLERIPSAWPFKE